MNQEVTVVCQAAHSTYVQQIRAKADEKAEKPNARMRLRVLHVRQASDLWDLCAKQRVVISDENPLRIVVVSNGDAACNIKQFLKDLAEGPYRDYRVAYFLDKGQDDRNLAAQFLWETDHAGRQTVILVRQGNILTWNNEIANHLHDLIKTERF